MNNLGIAFSSENDKLNDMKLLSMKDFLKSYSYLTSDDYLATVKDLLSRENENDEDKILNKIIPLSIENEAKKLFIKYAKNYAELDLLVEKYKNENISLASLQWEETMKQFYVNAINDFKW
ncbi:hypothetical protein [Aliarcobacter butzleri]|uniref:hypothetical protein n=1 Tax=Aliarcobacter butzleri TaxID=28197 RepID=UPI001269998F|nr:hypothetical protein [Aliarcobacter butzleri]